MRTAIGLWAIGVHAVIGCGGLDPEVEDEQQQQEGLVALTSCDHVATTGAHAYFEMLAGRPDCHSAIGLRSAAELASLPTSSSGSDKKKPIVYDPVMDAARIDIYAPVSADIQSKTVPIPVESGSVLLTWDFRFDEHFRWEQPGYLGRHKTWRLEPGPWIALKTDYREGAKVDELAELLINVPGARFIAPGSYRDGETLMPRVARFYFESDTWVRIWMFLENLQGPVSYVSVWVADEHRDPIQLYDKNPLYPTDRGLARLRIEYDTSADQAANPHEMHSWNRNVAALYGVSRAAVSALLERP